MIHVKKKGNAYFLYIDFATELPVPLSGYDDEPVDGTAVKLSLEEIQAKYGRDIKIFEAPQKEAPLAQSPLTPEELEAKIAETKNGQIPMLNIPARSEATTPQKPTAVSQDMLSEFRVMLTKYDAYEGKKKAQYGLQVTAVANFILAIAPGLQDDLNRMKQEISKPKFEL